ncbi:hypothetical protein FRC02_006982, partial [Tulasnella sp. 418]
EFIVWASLEPPKTGPRGLLKPQTHTHVDIDEALAVVPKEWRSTYFIGSICGVGEPDALEPSWK